MAQINKIQIGSTTYDVGVNLANVSGTLAIVNGGTGATTAAAARTALGITPANIGAATSSHTHAYLTSLGVQTPETERTSDRGGVYSYNTMSDTVGGAASYTSVIGFGRGTAGTVEIAGQWISTGGLWYRQLRDCIDNWFAWKKIWTEGDSVTGAVWNDYAEYRESDCQEFGRVLIEKGDDTLTASSYRLQPFAGVSSDTWGFCQGETEKAKTPIAVAGRVLAYPYQNRNNYQPGDCVCAAPNGTVDIMTREEIINYPDRIVGTVSCVPTYETWGAGDRDPVKVDGRIWIKVK